MIFQRYIRLLWRWWWLIVVGGAVAGGVTFVLTRQSEPVYMTSTTLLINQAPVTSVTMDLDSLRASESLARSYVELLQKRPVLRTVITNLTLDMTPSELLQKITVARVPNTLLLMLTVEDSDPERAADIANEMVKAFTAQNRSRQAQRYAESKVNLEQELTRIQAQMKETQVELATLEDATSVDAVMRRNHLQALLLQQNNSFATVFNSFEAVRLAEAQATNNLEIIEEAQPDRTPQNPGVWQNTLLALIMGSILALGVVGVVDYFDTSIKSGKEVESLIGVPTLATIGSISGAGLPDKLVTFTNVYSRVTEDYRLLRTNIEFAMADRGLHTLVITSSESLEGKSLTIINLAIALAQTGKRIILVDTNLRRPMLHEFFQQPNTLGVSTRLLLRHSERKATDYLTPTPIENLRLLPSGPLPSNPAELLGSRNMLALIEELKAQSDLVLFDSAPLLVAVDAMSLARVCDATLVVVRAEITRTDSLLKARGQLAQAGAKILGVVFNQAINSYRGHHKLYPQYVKPYQQRPTPLELNPAVTGLSWVTTTDDKAYKLYQVPEPSSRVSDESTNGVT